MTAEIIQILGLGIVGVLVILAISAGLVALGAWGYPKLKGEQQGYYYEKQIEALLLPWIYQAILGAYKVSEAAIDHLDARMVGADKAAIAGALYDMLPPKIGNIPIGTVKMIISREDFIRLVQVAFDEFHDEFSERSAEYRELLIAWKKQNT